MNIITYRYDRQFFCATHHLASCYRCRVEYTTPGYRRNDQEDDDRILVLGPGVNRFIPQWDEEIIGPQNASRIAKDYAKPPTPGQLTASDLLACKACELTWLKGVADDRAAVSHPTHNTLSHQHGTSRRSLIVHTDGACAGNGQSSARAGIGIYFGPRSQYNKSLQLRPSTASTSQTAELYALLKAMRVVHNEILPARSILIRRRKIKRFRLILVTDSSYAVECMCQHWQGWTLDAAKNVLRNRSGEAIVNSRLLLAIKDEVKKLAMADVQVMYYHVRREFNHHADALAKDGTRTQATLERHSLLI